MHAMRGLMWEQWRQGQPYLFAGMSVITLYFLAIRSLPGYTPDGEEVAFAWLVALITLCLVLPNHTLRGLCWRIPSRMSTLPVSHGKIVVALIAYRLTAAVVLSLCLGLGSLLLGVPGEGLAFLPVILVAGLWSALTLLFVTYFGIAAGVILSCAPFFLLLGIINYFYAASLTPLTLVAGGVMLGGLALSSLQSLPQGRFRTPVVTIALDTSRSPLATAVWHEWRQTFCWLPLAAAIPLLLFGLLLPPENLDAVLLTAVAPACAIGYYAFAPQRAAVLPLLRPVSVPALAHARLIAGAIAVAATAVIGVCVAAMVSEDAWGETLFIAAVATWLAMFSAGPLLLTGILVTPLFLLLSLVSDEEAVFMATLLAVHVLVILLTFGRAWKQRLLNRATAVFATVLFLAFTAVFMSLVESGEDMLMGVLASAMLITPIAWVPLVMQWQRHR